MYRVCVITDPQQPSAVLYQGIDKGVAYNKFMEQVVIEENTCVEMLIWQTDNGHKRAKWRTSRLYKKYR